MAENRHRPGRTLLVLFLAILAAIGALVVGRATHATGAAFTPNLALDLQGGTQLILTPRNTASGARDITQDDMREAIDIIRNRVDASGVSEAEITSLGNNNISVALPGNPSQDTLNLVRSSAIMRFRPVIMSGNPAPISPQAVASAEASASRASASGSPGAAPSPTATESVEQVAKRLADTDGNGTLSTSTASKPTDHSDTAWVSERLYYDFLVRDCSSAKARAQGSSDDPNKPIVACSADGTEKFILGPADVEGTHLTSATAGMETNSAGQSTGKWAVNLELDRTGADQFAQTSRRLYALQSSDQTRNRFAMVLDGNVISAPSMNAQITDGRAQITGNFTAASSKSLANQLSFGSLPLNFEVQSEQRISATLGSDQLQKGIWAGIAGLVLVVLYLAWHYHALACLSAGSLFVAAGITYLVITILSWTMGYRLSLPGVAGLIVSVGITADSFIVYFERIRDEVRDGHGLEVAVEQGWRRARRTIVVSDAVNLVAAAILYLLAVGGVQGFAFTLGITTLVDLVVIFMFTHPMMEVLIRIPFFGEGHRWSGLDPEHLGAKSSAIYVGRLRTRAAAANDAVHPAKSLAERRFEERHGVSVAAAQASWEHPHDQDPDVQDAPDDQAKEQR